MRRIAAVLLLLLVAAACGRLADDSTSVGSSGDSGPSGVGGTGTGPTGSTPTPSGPTAPTGAAAPTGPTDEHPRGPTGTPLGPTEDRLPILLTVLHSLVEDRGVPLYVNTVLCLEDFTTEMGDSPECPDRLSPEEQAAIATSFPEREVTFIEGTEVGGDRVTNGRAQVAWLGPPMVVEERIQVLGGEVCGGLCGHGSVYVVERVGAGWEVTGTAPGYGSWIS